MSPVSWSDLGWAMENLWAVSMGRQFFVWPRLGHQTNTHACLLSKLSNANYAIEASTLFIQQEVVESQQNNQL